VLQIKNRRYGRADIFLDLGDKKIIFEVKNKVYATLTDNQPKKYLEYLKATVKDGNYNSHLMFLIPKNYAFKEKIRQSWKNYSDVDKQLLYWEDFVKTLKDETDAHVKAFYDFCVYWFDLGQIHFTEDEMELMKDKSLLVPSLMAKLELMVIRIGTSLGWKWWGTEYPGFYYTKIIKPYELFVGIDYDAWEKYNQPINIFICHTTDTEFDPPSIEGVEFDAYERTDDENFYGYFAYVVKLEFSFEDEDYEEKLKNILEILINYYKNMKVKKKSGKK
jgi:hypothetical protein